MIGLIEFYVHVLLWSKTEDAKHKRNFPKSIFDQVQDKSARAFSLNIDEMDAFLSRPRKEVAN